MSTSANRERLMQVLLGPHVSEKATSLAEARPDRLQSPRRRDEDRRSQGRRALVRGQGRARGRRAHPGQEEALRPARRCAPGLEEGLRAARAGPRHQFHGRRVTKARGAKNRGVTQTQTNIAGSTVRRPRRQGRVASRAIRTSLARAVPQDAAAATTRAASRRGTRAAATSVTTASSTSSATRTASRARSSGSSTIRTARRISRSCSTQTASAATSWRRSARRSATRSCRASTRRSNRAARWRSRTFRSARSCTASS